MTWKSTTCSECGVRLPPAKNSKGKGRPRETCGQKCAHVRSIRRKREEREWRAQSKRADEENAAYLRDVFMPWARTGVWPDLAKGESEVRGDTP